MVSGHPHAPAALYPREKDAGTRFIADWVHLRGSLDTETRGKILSPLPGIEPQSPGHPAYGQTLYWLS
jgi:hypothetical protein